MSLNRIEASSAPIDELSKQAELLQPAEFTVQQELPSGARLAYKIMDKSLTFVIYDVLKPGVAANIYQSSDTLSLENGSLATGTLCILTRHILQSEYFGIATELRHRGLGQAYYRQLRHVARELGYKFICGYHGTDSAVRFFVNNGRYLLDEVKDEKLKVFEQLGKNVGRSSDATYTVDFLNPEDTTVFIRPERVNVTPTVRLEERAQQQELLVQLRKLWEWTNTQSKKFPFDVAKTMELITLLEEMNAMLPKVHQLAVLQTLREKPFTVSTHYVLGDCVNFFSQKVWLLAQLGRVQEVQKRVSSLNIPLE